MHRTWLELPLLQDALLPTLEGRWWIENDEEGSMASCDGATLTVLALPDGFEITLVLPSGKTHCVHTPPQHGFALKTIGVLARSFD